MNRTRIYLAGLFTSALIAFFLFLPVLASSLGWDDSWRHSSYFAFAHLCHQLPERSFSIGGAVLPVCCRCLGLYLGAMIGWALWRLAPENRRDRAASNLFLALTLAPVALDGLANYARIWDTSNWPRFLIGLWTGAAMARALWPAAVSSVFSIKAFLSGADNGADRIESDTLLTGGKDRG